MKKASEIVFRVLVKQVARLVDANTSPVFVWSAFYTAVYFLSKGYSWQNVKFLIQQSAMESARGTSNIAMNANNFWGMRNVSSRETTQDGTYNTMANGTFGSYATVSDGVVDRYLWDKEWGFTDLKGSMYQTAVASRYLGLNQSEQVQQAYRKLVTDTNVRSTVTTIVSSIVLLVGVTTTIIIFIRKNKSK